MSLLPPILLAWVGIFWAMRVFADYPVLLVGMLYVGVFGVCGIIGLVRTLFDRTSATQVGIRVNFVLLGAGVIAALATTAMIYGVLPSRAFLDPEDLLWFLLFPVLPILVALLEMRRLYRELPNVRALASSRLKPLWVVLAALPLVLAAARIAAEEAVIYWYGRDFLDVTTRAADRVAKGDPYCVLTDRGYVPDLGSLDKRRILEHAIRQNLKYRPMSPSTWRDPHFRIVVGDRAYWWSFKQRSFVFMQGHAWSEPPPRGCPAVIQTKTGPDRYFL